MRKKYQENVQVYAVWKKSLTTWEECMNGVRDCKDTMMKVKVHLELNLVREMKHNMKGLFKYVNSKRKMRENAGFLFNRETALVTANAEKGEMVNIDLASVFTSKTAFWTFQIMVARDKVWRKDAFPMVEEGSEIIYTKSMHTDPWAPI